MHIRVNGVRLYVDIEGPGLVPDGPLLREKQSLILLHGGPGADHSIYKPGFSQLSDLVQIIYLDHRGNGRSEDGDPALWTLDQWADDLARLIDTLGIPKPIIYGASFGGFVAQAFATKYPDVPNALILAATSAKVDFEVICDAFTRIGGAEAGTTARTYWSAPTPERRKAYFEKCLPHYSVKGPSPDVMARLTVKNPVAMHFNGPGNEMGQLDFRNALARITCPTLVLSGSHDPMMPLQFSKVIVDHLTQAEVTHHTLKNAGHMLENDQSERFFTHLRDFIQKAPV